MGYYILKTQSGSSESSTQSLVYHLERMPIHRPSHWHFDETFHIYALRWTDLPPFRPAVSLVLTNTTLQSFTFRGYFDKCLGHISDWLVHPTSNEYLVLLVHYMVSTLTCRLSPVGSGSGVQVIEGESFKMNILLAITGLYCFCCLWPFFFPTGTIDIFGRDSSRYVPVLQKISDIYADAVMKVPFHTPGQT